VPATAPDLVRHGEPGWTSQRGHECPFDVVGIGHVGAPSSGITHPR
jgi:hypothetical protein